ncbi:MAG: hypothetical protein EP330_20065 [Deltaproteobacteria bacterium]|nr:MAG: hypothetical protein EP330_20065 [Deltaproteobacteria bacterium]
MHPWLVYSESLQLPTYFTCLMVGFALSLAFVRREAQRSGFAPKVVLDAAFWLLPGALIGARLAHVVLVDPQTYLRDPWMAIVPTGGWVFYGGFLGGLVAGWRYASRRGLSFAELADCYVIAIPFGLIWGRLGCLGGGCCFGRAADFPFGWPVPWSVTYTARGHLPDEFLAMPLHPAPIYAMLHAAWLVLAIGWVRRHQTFRGEAMVAFIALYGVGRSVLEVFRADASRGLYFGGWLSTSQIIGLGTAALAFALWAARRRASIPS